MVPSEKCDHFGLVELQPRPKSYWEHLGTYEGCSEPKQSVQYSQYEERSGQLLRHTISHETLAFLVNSMPNCINECIARNGGLIKY